MIYKIDLSAKVEAKTPHEAIEKFQKMIGEEPEKLVLVLSVVPIATIKKE